MLVVFVIDTSPSMGTPIGSSSTTRLDLGKMAAEDVVKKMRKRVHEHNSNFQQFPLKRQEQLHNIGLGYSQKDEYLLITTAPQHGSQTSTATCGAGGRLLVGFGTDHYAGNAPTTGSGLGNCGNHTMENPLTLSAQQNHGIDSFQTELKCLKSTTWPSSGKQNHNQYQKKRHVEKLSDLQHTLKDALNCNKPAVINVDVDPKALYSFRRDSFKHKQK